MDTKLDYPAQKPVQKPPRAPRAKTAINRIGLHQGNLLDELLKRLRLKNDAALSRVLGVQPPVISKIRHAQVPVGASVLIRMHEVSNLAISELRALMGVPDSNDRSPRMT